MAQKDRALKGINGMMFEPHGNHLVGGDWVGGDGTFLSEPAAGPAQAFAVGTVALVDAA